MTATAVEARPARRRMKIPVAWRQPLAIVGVVIAVAWILIAIFAPLIAPYGSLEQSFTPAQSPSWSHLFGTDELGRDVLSRVIYGSRASLPIALVLVALALTIGSLVGAVAGYFRGLTDGTLMRFTDLVFAFPPIILAMVVAAVLGRGLFNAALAIVVVAWPSYARVSRGLVLSVGESEYVQSARLLGSSSRRTLFRDVLPNVAGPIFVLATLDLGDRNPAPRGPLVPRPRRPAAAGGMGLDGRRRNAVLPVVVDRHVPGTRDLLGRARLQLPR